MFRNASSIGRKLNLIVAVTTVVALALAAAALLLVDFQRGLNQSRGEARTLTDVIALASAPALSFSDPKVATENLSMLRANPSVVRAMLYDAKGRLFASFRANPSMPTVAPLPHAEETGVSVSGNFVDAWRPVVSNGERVGTIWLQMRHERLSQVLKYVGVVVLIMAASLAGALLLSRRLQRAITQPIVEVSDVARNIITGKAKGVRAIRRTDDEVGNLVDAFNAMLDDLERRSNALQEANSALHDAQRVLKDANRAKDEFLATLAHELRNPLAPIRTGLEILNRDKANGPHSEHARATMERQLAHMVRLIDDLLDISRINSGKIQIAPERVDLLKVVETALELSRPAIDAAGHQLEVDLPREPVFLMGDPTRLAQALGNLLNNASRYTPAGGRIALRVRPQGEVVEITVEDNGEGIPANMLESIFQLFTQVRVSGRAAQGGLGIGLYLVRSLVELHGGTVTADSPGEGLGSTFTVRLPCLPAQTARASGSAEGHAARGLQGLKVLIVDDNVDAAETLATVLEMEGCKTSMLHRGGAVLEEAAAFDPDVILLDIGLPDMTGYQVAQQLRRDPAFARTELIAITGWGTEEDRTRSELAGFDHHLTKPVEIGALEPLLRNAARSTPQ
jgi:signal transduction histidine kinase